MKKLLQRLDYFFSFKQYPVNNTWDDMLNNLLDNHHITEVDRYTVTFDSGKQLWIGNKWYAFGQPYMPAIPARPRAATAIKLWNAIENQHPDDPTILSELKRWNNA